MQILIHMEAPDYKCLNSLAGFLVGMGKADIWAHGYMWPQHQCLYMVYLA